jgi:dTDP-4-amino-4,6-dideoxygalactose transaminase
MAAILIELKPGDEIIMPAYTFVSTANAFVLRGAVIRFCDSRTDHPGIDEDKIEALINKKTRAIVVVHYAGVACDMDKIQALGIKYKLFVIEDAAPAIDSFYNRKPLGSLGTLGTFSFHETKNIIAGEGGMLSVNDSQFIERAEIIREKGTNRSRFFRGEVDKYNWVDIGSSFLPSDLVAAFLFAQLEQLDEIQEKRKLIWKQYRHSLQELEDKEYIGLPVIPGYATNNAHMFYIVVHNEKERVKLISWLRSNNIVAVFHYLSLHKSPFFHDKHDGRELPNADRFSECLIRLPFYYALTETEQSRVIESIHKAFK